MLTTNDQKIWAHHPLTPRAWQLDALPRLLISLKTPRSKGVIVQAVMGAGKSVLLAELARVAVTSSACVVVVAPKRMLIDQLACTLRSRLGDVVGEFHGKAKQDQAPVVVCCTPSFAKLAARLAARGREVNLIIFDEAHRSETQKILAAVQNLSPGAVVGFTATPFRSNSNEKLTLFDDVVVSYSFQDAIRDGVLVPYEVKTWTAERAERAGVSIDDRDAVCLAMIQSAQGAGVVSADTVADAKLFCDYLSSNGIHARVITGQTPDNERARSLRELQSGRIKCVIHVNVLTEGVDLPWLRWLCLRRASASKVRYPQEVGRVLRSHPGKTMATVYDPHALSMIRSLNESADLWKPARILAFMPDDEVRAKKMRRWLNARDFTSIMTAYESAGIDPFLDEIIARKIPRVLIWDCDTLSTPARQHVKGASVHWDSETLVKINQVIKTPIHREFVSFTASGDEMTADAQRAAIDDWALRLGKICVGSLHSPSIHPLAFDVDVRSLVCINRRVLPIALERAVLDAGGRITQVAPDTRMVDATTLDSGVALVHECHVALDAMGAVTRRAVSSYQRALPCTEAQAEYLRSIQRRVRSWTPQAPTHALDLLRPLVRDGMKGYMPMGLMSDLIGVISGVSNLGGWPW